MQKKIVYTFPFVFPLSKEGLRIFEAHSLDPEYHTEKAQIAFWQQGEYYPLTFCELDAEQMYDKDVRWTHWQSSQFRLFQFQ